MNKNHEVVSKTRADREAACLRFKLGDAVIVHRQFKGVVEDIFTGQEDCYGVAAFYDFTIAGYTYRRFGVLQWREAELEPARDY